MKKLNLNLVLLIFLLAVFHSVGVGQNYVIQEPVLKWKNGGCFPSWCEKSWYSAPVIIDIEGDGSLEIIGSAYSIFVIDAETGELEWKVASGHDMTEPEADNEGRTWADVIVEDVDNDGNNEIITAHSNGYISVYNHEGYFEAGWPQRPVTNEFRALKVFDLDADGTMEIIASAATLNKQNTWVYEHNGTIRNGWPQLTHPEGYSSGVYNNNISVGDIDNNGQGEIVVPSDVHYICAYYPDGSVVAANAIYGNKVWSEVGVWESLATEIQGWGTCNSNDGREQRYRANFASSGSCIVDVNNDNIKEVVVIGNVYDCALQGGEADVYQGVYIFNADRSRFKTGNYDWETLPVDMGAPNILDYNIIEDNHPNPEVADLDGDGIKEIIYSSYDGCVHALWLDKTEHHNWPYCVYDPNEGIYRKSSPPVAIDLNGDNYKEVIFTSWPEIGSGETGELHILDYQGNVLHEVELPASPPSTENNWNGAMAKPVVGNIDGDSEFELVLNSVYSGVVVYDLPGTFVNAEDIQNEYFGDWNIFPVPVQDIVNVTFNFSERGDVKINIYNILGQLVYSKNVTGYSEGEFTEQINCSEFNKGVYVIELLKGECIGSKKFVVE
jgi:hypothetical protein